MISDYEKQLRTLKDEIAALSAEKSALQGRSDKFSQIDQIVQLVSFSILVFLTRIITKQRISAATEACAKGIGP